MAFANLSHGTGAITESDRQDDHMSLRSIAVYGRGMNGLCSLSEEFIASATNFVKARRTHFLVLGCVALFVASLARYWVSYDPCGSVDHDPESFRLARSLHDRGEFADPFAALPTGSSAHLAPVFPAFLALMMRVFGDGNTGIFAIKLAAALILSLQLALYPLFSRTLGMGVLNGFIAASIWIVAKVKITYNWEAFYAAILLALCCHHYRRYLHSQTHGPARRPWLLGCLMGLSILTMPTVALIFTGWVGWEVWRRRAKVVTESFLALVLLPGLILTPWIIRNYEVFHTLVLVRDNFGLVLSASNNDCAEFAFAKDWENGCHAKVNPNLSRNEATRVLQLGEVEYNKSRLREALEWIREHPTRFAKLTAWRVIAFWMPTETGTIHYAGPGRRVERVAIYLMTILSGVGIVLLSRRDVTSVVVCMSCLTLFPIVYYIAEYEDRYRYPIMWVTFLLGALPITTCMVALQNLSAHVYRKHASRSYSAALMK
jgi:hypothetical protein